MVGVVNPKIFAKTTTVMPMPLVSQNEQSPENSERTVSVMKVIRVTVNVARNFVSHVYVFIDFCFHELFKVNFVRIYFQQNGL